MMDTQWVSICIYDYRQDRLPKLFVSHSYPHNQRPILKHAVPKTPNLYSHSVRNKA